MTEESLFLAALEKSVPADRAAFLKEACGANAVLQARVQMLLEAHARSRGILDRSVRSDPELTVVYPPGEQPGVVVAGRYKLLEAIGEGGMGTVWVAEQIQPMRRTVALKLIKVGMDSKTVLARFEAERQALAVMDHPNIAKVLDGGLTETGRPFFVMEYVKGVPITEYCDAARLSIPDRLLLFDQVCQAVQHAHLKGIIHRDLKPSNILVAPYDGKPVPKVIDFGLAKAIHQSLTERTLHTAHEVVLGTPLYMSPEQAQLNNLDVDTRADVYSLGVLLYELLTGTTPLEKQQFKEAAWDEVRRLIREEEPPRPSLRLSSTATLPSLAAGRQTEPARLTKLVRGELDWIVMKALEKDRARRYESANAFGSDVRRFLAGEPVLAAPPNARYRLVKFARKHRAALSTTAAIVVLLAAGVVVSTWQAVRATRANELARDAERQADLERDKAQKAEGEAKEQRDKAIVEKQRADDEASVARAVNDFLQDDLLAEAAPERNARAMKVTVEEVLNRAAERIAGRFEQQPRIEAAIRMTIGDTYQRLGDYPAAQPHLERALALRRQTLGTEHADTFESMNSVAGLYYDQGEFAKAEPLFVETLELRRRILGEEHELTLQSLNNLANLYQDQNRFAEAEPLLRKALEVSRRVLGEEHPRTLLHLNSLAVLFKQQGQFTQAEPLYVKVLEVRRRVLGDEHPLTLVSMNNLALLYDARGDYAQAEPLLVQTLAATRRVFGDGHPDTLFTINNLAWVYQDHGEFGRAEPLLRELLDKSRHAPVGGSRFADSSTAALGENLLRQRKYTAAEPLLRECLASYSERDPDAWITFHAKSLLGDALLGMKQYADAEPLLLASYDGMKQRAANMSPAGMVRLPEVLDRLIELYTATDQPAEAEKWQAERSKYPPRAAPAREKHEGC